MDDGPNLVLKNQSSFATLAFPTPPLGVLLRSCVFCGVLHPARKQTPWITFPCRRNQLFDGTTRKKPPPRIVCRLVACNPPNPVRLDIFAPETCVSMSWSSVSPYGLVRKFWVLRFLASVWLNRAQVSVWAISLCLEFLSRASCQICVW